MPLPRCPACGSLIFPSARDGGDVSPLCESCQDRAKKTGHAGPAPRFAASEVREEVIEPSGPFLLPAAPAALPPEEVLAHLDARSPVPAAPEVVVEPSGPFVMPGSPPPAVNLEEPPSSTLGPTQVEVSPSATGPTRVEVDDGAPGRSGTETGREGEDIVEPSGPFLALGPQEGPAAEIFDLSSAPADASTVVGGISRSAPRHGPDPDPAAPSIMVETQGRRAEATMELPRELRQALTPMRVQTSLTALAFAFAAGLIAGVVIAIVVLKL